MFRNNSVAALGIACIDTAQQSCCFVSEDGDYAYIHCTTDGWATAHEALADKNEGAALVEVAVSMGPNGTSCYVAAGGYVTGAGQSPVFYRSCDAGASWVKDPLPAWPVENLLATDIVSVYVCEGGGAMRCVRARLCLCLCESLGPGRSVHPMCARAHSRRTVCPPSRMARAAGQLSGMMAASLSRMALSRGMRLRKGGALLPRPAL